MRASINQVSDIDFICDFVVVSRKAAAERKVYVIPKEIYRLGHWFSLAPEHHPVRGESRAHGCGARFPGLRQWRPTRFDARSEAVCLSDGNYRPIVRRIELRVNRGLSWRNWLSALAALRRCADQWWRGRPGGRQPDR